MWIGLSDWDCVQYLLEGSHLSGQRGSTSCWYTDGLPSTCGSKFCVVLRSSRISLWRWFFVVCMCSICCIYSKRTRSLVWCFLFWKCTLSIVCVAILEMDWCFLVGVSLLHGYMEKVLLLACLSFWKVLCSSHCGILLLWTLVRGHFKVKFSQIRPFFWICAGFENREFVLVPDASRHVLVFGNVSCACWHQLCSTCRDGRVDKYDIQCLCVVLHVSGYRMSSSGVGIQHIWSFPGVGDSCACAV